MKVTGARINIQWNGNKEVYFRSNDISEVRDRFEGVRRELVRLKTHFVRNLSTIIETYDETTNTSRLYYISLVAE